MYIILFIELNTTDALCGDSEIIFSVWDTLLTLSTLSYPGEGIKHNSPDIDVS